MRKMFIFIVAFSSLICLAAIDARGDGVVQLQTELAALRCQFNEMKVNYEERICQLETKIEGLTKTYSMEAPEEKAAVPAQTASVGRYLQSFNPEISAIGDFVYHGTDTKDTEFRNQFQMRQTELAFSASVDPYARGDFFFHVEQEDGEWHIGLCEGYMTLLSLPVDDLQAKVGKFKVDFGKANKLHLHNLPWVDYPNMVTHYFGGEGMSEPGVSASYLMPNPWDKYIELTGQVVNNRNGASFAGTDGKDLVYLGHLKSFFDINDESTVELGSSAATGSNGEGHGKYGKNMTTLEGVDLTYKWRPLQQGLYRSLVFQNELLFSQKDRPYFDDGTDIIEGKRIDSWGAYSSLEYQFTKNWSVFGRYDFAEFPDSSSQRDNAYSVGLTLAQSEYCFWRLQFKHTDRNYGKDSNEIWLQCDFGIGPHRAHQY